MGEYPVPRRAIHDRSLFKFAINGGVGRAALYMTHSEAANFAGNRYWGFIERYEQLDGWSWRITPRGYDYLDKLISVPRVAIIEDAELKRYADHKDLVYFGQDVHRQWHRNDYARAARMIENGQGILFEQLA